MLIRSPAPECYSSDPIDPADPIDPECYSSDPIDPDPIDPIR